MHLSGPYGSLLMADMGAEVIKIEPPTGDPTRASGPLKGEVPLMFAAINRNKKSVSIDLRDPRGRELFLRVVAEADIVFHNFRPGVMDRLGLSTDILKEANPKIIVGQLSGYGTTSPRRNAPAFDVAIQARSGVMGITGHPGTPPARAGVPIADLAGGMFLVISVLAALVKRGRVDEPVELDISMFDCQLSLLMYWAALALNLNEDIPPQGSGNSKVVPYGAYETTDSYIIIAVFSNDFWPKLCRAIGRPDLESDPRYRTNNGRVELRDELEREIAAEFKKADTATWLKVLDEHDVPSGPVNGIRNAFAEPDVEARDMLLDITADGLNFAFAGNPIKSSHEFDGRELAPRLGQHTREVLADLLKLDEAALADLHSAGVLRTDTHYRIPIDS
ncbi:hypothetical protein BCD48_38100 [Pseudofrankia sp. BMG5.36]|nr:hypothetical protein BCD48_38100 [Pseudofrankia sp. BMG5.36]